ncbi:hypothetical protein NL676_022345 [Syzygium grande]|nr:hypothetical protein NL676_022345 [Syzygium grande]
MFAVKPLSPFKSEVSGPVFRLPLAAGSLGGGKIDVRVVISIRKKIRQKLVDKIENSLESFMNGIGQGIMLQLVSEEFTNIPGCPWRAAMFSLSIIAVTRSGKTIESSVRGWLPNPSRHSNIAEYAADLRVSLRTLVVKELSTSPISMATSVHLLEIMMQGFSEGPIHFPANTRFHARKDNPERIET